MNAPRLDPEGRPLIASLFGDGYGYCGESLAGNQESQIAEQVRLARRIYRWRCAFWLVAWIIFLTWFFTA
jgi:hypothetical protein